MLLNFIDFRKSVCLSLKIVNCEEEDDPMANNGLIYIRFVKIQFRNLTASLKFAEEKFNIECNTL